MEGINNHLPWREKRVTGHTQRKRLLNTIQPPKSMHRCFKQLVCLGAKRALPGGSTSLRRTLDSGLQRSNGNNKSLSVLEISKGFFPVKTQPHQGFRGLPTTHCQDQEMEKDGWMMRKKEISPRKQKHKDAEMERYKLRKSEEICLCRSPTPAHIADAGWKGDCLRGPQWRDMLCGPFPFSNGSMAHSLEVW